MEPILTIRPPIKLSSTLVDKIIFFIPVDSEIADTTCFCWSWSSSKGDVTSALTSPLILDTSEYMFKRLNASGFFSKDFKLSGIASESDFAFLIFL